MRIRRLELRNFNGYEHLDLTFDQPRTLLVGENGTGKSTIPDAIALALTGECRGVNTKGEGQRDLVRTGAAEATIALWIDGLDPVTLSIDTSRGATRGKPIDMVLGNLRTSKPYLTAALYGATFFSMHHADAKKLMMDLLNVRVAVPPEEPDADEATNPPPKLMTLDQVEARYRHWFDERATTKKAVAAVIVGDVKPRPDLDGQDMRALNDAVESQQQAYQAAVGVTADVRASGNELRRKIADLERTAIDPATSKSKVATHEEMLAKHRTEAEEARTKLQAIEATKAEPIETLSGQVQELKVFIGRVEGQAKPGGGAVSPSTSCVLGGGIPCLTPGSEFKTVIAKTKKDLAAIEKRIKAGTKRATDLGAARQAVDDADRHCVYHKAQIEALQNGLRLEEERRTRLDAARDELSMIEPDLARGEESVQAARAALSMATERASDLRAYQAAIKARDLAAERKASLQADLKDAEAWVEIYGPTGRRVDALQKALGDFHQTINAALEPFGFTMTINPDPWKILVRHQGTTAPVPFTLLSKGQRLWTQLAFQMVMAAISGLDFCVVDDVESVVGANLERLTNTVMNMPIGQILILKAQSADAAVPDIEGLQVIRTGAAEPVTA